MSAPHSSSPQLQDLAARLVEAARKAGADQADALAVSSRQLSAGVRDGALEKSESSESVELGLRVLVGQKQALIATSDTSPASLAQMVARVMDMARVASDDPFAGLPQSGLWDGSSPELDLFDATERSSAALEQAAKQCEQAMLDVAGVSKSSGAGASASQSSFYMVASNGFSGGYQRSGFSLSATAIAGQGTAMERDYAASYRTHFTDLEAAHHIGTLAGARAVRRLAPRKIETCRLPVIFDERIAPSLIGHFLSAINGAMIARKTSFLQNDLDNTVFSKAVQIIDNPLLRRGLASRPFDDEGLPSRSLTLIENGVLTSWILDTACARELGLASTGHGVRGVGSRPHPSSSNVVLQAGQRSPQDMIASLQRGLLVTDLIGHGPNLVTGDYSRGCSGFLIENGEIVCPVAEITIAGHLRAMFAALEPANDLDMRRSVDAPSCFIGEMTVAGR